MGAIGGRRAGVVAVLAIVAAAMAIWVVPAFSGGTAGQWTWVSGNVFSDNLPDNGTAVLTAYNAGDQPADVTVRAVEPGGAVANPTTAASQTIQPGRMVNFAWNCSDGFGCSRSYELTTAGADVVPSLTFDEVGTSGLTYAGLVPPGGFTVFGPEGSSTPAGVAATGAAATALRADAAQLRGDATTVKADTANLRRSVKKLRKQMKQVLKAVR